MAVVEIYGGCDANFSDYITENGESSYAACNYYESVVPTCPNTLLSTENAPTIIPTINPSLDPTDNPTTSPTGIPTNIPSVHPTKSPSEEPTSNPSRSATNLPTAEPSKQPTNSPIVTPTGEPTLGYTQGLCCHAYYTPRYERRCNLLTSISSCLSLINIRRCFWDDDNFDCGTPAPTITCQNPYCTADGSRKAAFCASIIEYADCLYADCDWACAD